MAATPELTVSAADYRYFVERAVRGMADIVAELGDELACVRPNVPGANSGYGLLTHCLGVLAYWGGHLIAGREVQRDRAAEFEATGTVTELLGRVADSLWQFQLDLAELAPAEPLRHQPASWSAGPERTLNQGAAALHIYEEVAQHHGQLQVLRDVLLAGRTAPAGFDDLPLDWLRAKQSVKWHRPGPQLLPAWVADMDFPVAAPISAAIERAVRAGDLGYPDWPNHPLAEPFSRRMDDRYGWQPEPSHVRGVTDLIQALQIVLTLATDPGDGVIAHVPNYPPFLATVERMGRTLIPAQLTPDGDASWSWDHERLAAQLAGGRPRMLLLVNPHNPTGRVFSRDELQLLADCAERHDLVVVSDEIHAELAHRPYRHVPFASLSPSAAARTVTVTSATKAFNIAGLRTAVAHVGPAELRARWDDQPPDLFGGAGVLGAEATRAAWAEGDSWLAALNDHLLGQRDHLVDRLAALPMLRLRPPQASYLAWLDCTAAELPMEPAQWFRERAGVELSAGVDFGPGGAGHARLNFATSRAVLDELVDRIAASLRG